MNRRLGHTEWYQLSGEGQEFYVKQQLYPSLTDFPTVSLLFGGVRTFCVVVAVKTETSAYIDRVEFDEFCNKAGKMEENKSMEILLKCALWFTLQLYPKINIFTLKDDSNIYCIKKAKTHKLSLAYDYILKYGQTWYEKKFHAALPDDMAHVYKKSQVVLDAPLIPFENAIKVMDNLKPYESTYRIAKTPKEFIQSLRTKLGLDTYCMEVGKWLTKYMELLNIQMFKDKWFILSGMIKAPNGFEVKRLLNEPKMGGGARLRIRREKRKTTCKSKASGGAIGYYNAADEY